MALYAGDIFKLIKKPLAINKPMDYAVSWVAELPGDHSLNYMSVPLLPSTPVLIAVIKMKNPG
jgi:hypothetical protein